MAAPAAGPSLVLNRQAAWRALGLAAIAATLFALGAGYMRAQAAAALARGDALYQGRAPLEGRLDGHALALPAEATRCGNCHDRPAVAPAGTTGNAFAATLTAASLATPKARRGGPPSRYDAASLCNLLRTGVDPAQVMIDSGMPRYQPTDAQCQDLWTYLLTR